MSSPQSEISFEVSALKQGYQVIQALNHDLRVKLLKYIHRQGQATVIDIYRPLKLEQAVVSLHLGILRRAGLVNANREGRNIYYSVNYKRLAQIQGLAGGLLQIASKTIGGKKCYPCKFPLVLRR